MKLATLLQCIDVVLPQAQQDLIIKNIKVDSRTIEPGDLFIAVAGLVTDGRQYIQQAIAKGAVAVLVEGFNDKKLAQNGFLPTSVPSMVQSVTSHGLNVDSKQHNVNFYQALHNNVVMLEIEDLEKKLGIIASQFYSNPSNKMSIVGVTGTNGKSSTCHYIAEILRHLSGKTAVIGTLGIGTVDGYVSGTHTTPEPVELQKNLAMLLDQGMQTIAMEVSSHALMQARVNGIKFDTTVFTNLTQDHLDYHENMANYWQAKLKLFLDFSPVNAVINLDDPYGRQLLELLAPDTNIIGYSLEVQRKAKCNSILATDIKYTGQGIATTLICSSGRKTVNIPVMGDFNLSNMLAAIASCITLGHAFDDIVSVIHKVTNIPGRMQCISSDLQPLVVVDYAHTPDALARVLKTLRDYCHGKLWCVFGCGGDRDRTKRTTMLATAVQFSDYIVLTQDNPRTEDPIQIIEDTLKNHYDLNNVVVEQDRRAAIQLALSKAAMQDIVLIAGKGHENYQIIGTTYLPFSDIAVVMEILDSPSLVKRAN